MYAGLLTFLGGTAVLLVAAVVQGMVGALPAMTWPPADRWWLYTGGLFGMAFVVAAALVVQRIGVLVLASAVVAGQLLGALALDAATGGLDIGWATIAAVLAVLAAVLLALDTTPASPKPLEEQLAGLSAVRSPYLPH